MFHRLFVRLWPSTFTSVGTQHCTNKTAADNSTRDEATSLLRRKRCPDFIIGAKKNVTGSGHTRIDGRGALLFTTAAELQFGDFRRGSSGDIGIAARDWQYRRIVHVRAASGCRERRHGLGLCSLCWCVVRSILQVDCCLLLALTLLTLHPTIYLSAGIYLYNLISGLMLAEVAINLHETSDCEVPSSFKDFADCAMADSTSAGNAIGAASLLMNSCFLSYGMVQVGSFVSDTMDVGFLDPTAVAALYSLLLLVAFCTQKTCGIETIANMAVMVLFASFASLLLPSLAHVHPLFEAFAASSSAATTTTMPDGSLASALSATIPLIVSTMIYQNIVPSITKLLDFDRTKSTIAIALGSLLPMLMYVAWCFAVLGGGLDTSLENNGVGGAMFAAFTASSFVGSSIGCVLSLAEEYESILSSAKRRGDLDYEKVDSCAMTQCGFSVPAVVMSVLPPAAVALAASSGTDGAFTAPLHLSGAVIAPFLYGLLPIMLFRSMQSDAKSDVVSSDDFNLMDTIPQVLLGASTVGLLGNELVHDVGNWLS